jgi:transcriptional regulator with XRE-family HTH domain
MNKTIYSRQGARLRELIVEMRRKAGLSQRQLAARLKRERNLVGRLESGERRLEVIEFFWICKACDANPEKMARKLMRNLEEIESSIAD